VLILLIAQIGLIWYLVGYVPANRVLPVQVGEHEDEATEEGEHPESLLPIPKELRVKMQGWLQGTETGEFSSTEECDWLNLVLHRLFLSLRQSTLFRKRWASQVRFI
jgi:hypothetical protein